MTRPNPVCAWCGKPFKRGDGSMLITYPWLDGHPYVAWHLGDDEKNDCAANDKKLKEWAKAVDIERLERIPQMLDFIRVRGPMRVRMIKKKAVKP